MTRDFKAPDSPKKSLNDFLGQGQPEAKLEAMWQRFSSLLIPDEQIEHFLVQNSFALKLFPGAVVLTNRRVLFAESNRMQMEFHDVMWRNLLDAKLKETWTGAVLSFQDVDGRLWGMRNLPKPLARSAYAFAQKIEELAIEFRRQRALEETRAAARGVAVEAVSPVSYAPPALAAPSPEEGPSKTASEALSQLKGLWDSGLISEEEFQAKRSEILARL